MKYYNITKRLLIDSIIGTIYEMAPGNHPRNIGKIVEHIKKWCQDNIGNKYLIKIKEEDLKDTIKDLLYSCKEFTQLNISQKLWDDGVRDYNDDRNSGFGITAVGHDRNGTPCSFLTPDEYCDFIDLDACVDNCTANIAVNCELREDCFLCVNSEEYQSMKPSNSDICNTCILNPNHKCNYETDPKALIPHNKTK